MSLMTLFSCTMGASFVAGNHWVWSGIRPVCAVSDPIKATAIPLDVGLPHPPPPRYDSWFQILEDNKKKRYLKKKIMFPYIF